MGWLGWTVTGIVVVVGVIFTMSMMVAASRADDRQMGDRQYETD